MRRPRTIRWVGAEQVSQGLIERTHMIDYVIHAVVTDP